MTLAVVCGIWQCVTVLAALSQDDVGEKVMFVVDLAVDSKHLSVPIVRFIRSIFPDNVIHIIIDERPKSIGFFLAKTTHLKKMGICQAERVYFAYFTYTINHILSIVADSTRLVLADDGIGHYDGVQYIDSSQAYTTTKRIVDRVLFGYCTSRVHGITHSRFARRVRYHHVLDSSYVPPNIFKQTTHVQRVILHRLLDCCFDTLVANSNGGFNKVRYVVLGEYYRLREVNSSLSELVLNAPFGVVLFKPHPRDNRPYDELARKQMLLPNYIPVECLFGKYPEIKLVENGSSATLQCQELYGVTTISVSQFLIDINGLSEC